MKLGTSLKDGMESTPSLPGLHYTVKLEGKKTRLQMLEMNNFYGFIYPSFRASSKELLNTTLGFKVVKQIAQRRQSLINSQKKNVSFIYSYIYIYIELF